MLGQTGVLDRIDRARHDALMWRHEAAFWKKVLLSLAGAAFVGMLAQIRVPLPWSPVPVTGQTFGVFLAAVLLGRIWGGVSMAIYISAGLLGVPWFSGGGLGLSSLAGPTGGYLMGFIVAALAVGHISDKYVNARGLLPLFLLMLGANFLIIHGLGLIQLAVYLGVIKGKALSLGELLWMGTVPFIPGDITKAALAAALARALIPKVPLHREVH
jgi:biotin transport system substrate-specific component